MIDRQTKYKSIRPGEADPQTIEEAAASAEKNGGLIIQEYATREEVQKMFSDIKLP